MMKTPPKKPTQSAIPKLQYSMSPHILQISNTIKGKGSAVVTLFNRADALFTPNYGNPEGIEIKYASANPLVPYSYRKFLFDDIYMKIGRMEARSMDKKQAKSTMTLLNNVGAGSFDGESLFMLKPKKNDTRGLSATTKYGIGVCEEAFWVTPKTMLYFELKNGASVDLFLYVTTIFDPTQENGALFIDKAKIVEI